MTDYLAKQAALQAAYEAKRPKAAGATTMPLVTYRVVMPDGREVVERCIGLSQVAAQWPDARLVERVGDTVGAFW